MTGQIVQRGNFLLYLQEREGYDRPVLIKEPARDPSSKLQIKQLHNEYNMSKPLEGVPGVRPVYAKEGSQSRPVLLLEYVPGQTISELVRSPALDLQQKIDIAVEAAAILGRIHGRGITHKNINSDNILVTDDGSVTIIDFGAATDVSQEIAQTLNGDDAFGGTLAYLSPEQTGRMNRSVDYRSDLYSLGVTLYELFTNQLPFQASDTLGLIHAHIAIEPVSPQALDTGLPQAVSNIILKLLAKNAEDRYQSANGLQSDLEQCQLQMQTDGRIKSFVLGEEDFSGRLQIPQKLYGRQSELNTIMARRVRKLQCSIQVTFRPPISAH